MPVLRVKKNGVWEDIMGGSNSEQLNGGNADTLDGKHASDFLTKQENNALIEALRDDIGSALNDKADSDHSHSTYVNQNAFSNIKVGTTTIAADTTTDTLTLVAGNNITLTPNSSSDQITISATNTTYTHPNSGVTAGTYKSVTVNAQGHVTSGSNPTTLSGYGITDGASKSYVSTQINNALANFESSKTLTQHLQEEDVILTSRQYGDTLPTPGVPGRIFFKRVYE